MASFFQGEQLVSVRRLELFNNGSYTVPSGYYEELQVIYYNGDGAVIYIDGVKDIGIRMDNLQGIFPMFTLAAGDTLSWTGIGSGLGQGVFMTVKRFKNP